jgi:hypothetical protein
VTNSRSVPNAKRPRHLWLVGVFALLWNAMGALDYLMTVSRNSSYLSAFTAEQLDYLTGFPEWATAAWALGVWGGVAGSLLLAAGRRLAVPALGVSLLAAALTFVYEFGLSDGLRVMGGASALAMPAVVLLAGTLLLFYARRMARAGHLH